MIQSIEIENFRCFHQTKLEGFKRVNLIGGQNNAGKTALLEAVFWTIEPTKGNEMIEMREKSKKDRIIASDALENIFCNSEKDLTNKSKIIVNNDSFSNESIFNLKILKNSIIINNNKFLIAKYIFASSFAPITDSEINQDVNSFFIYKTSENFIQKEVEGNYFIQSKKEVEGNWLAIEYDKLYKLDKTEYIIDAFRIFIPSILDVRSADPNRPSLYLKEKGKKPLPISSFGDAINRMAEFVIRIINSRGGVVLIDEIENGIHYSHHKEVWAALFKLAKLFDVQLFATSHSLEMIRAFNEVAMTEGFEEDAQYIEMFRSARSGEIVGNPMTLETLKYCIINGASFRGAE